MHTFSPINSLATKDLKQEVLMHRVEKCSYTSQLVFEHLCTIVLVSINVFPSYPLSRHRLSEADEDEELMDEDDLTGSTITRFSENPWCE